MRTHRGAEHPRFHVAKGKVMRRLGWLTADRHVEAVGEAEAQLRRRPDPSTIERVEHEVNRRYGETLDSE